MNGLEKLNGIVAPYLKAHKEVSALCSAVMQVIERYDLDAHEAVVEALQVESVHERLAALRDVVRRFGIALPETDGE